MQIGADSNGTTEDRHTRTFIHLIEVCIDSTGSLEGECQNVEILLVVATLDRLSGGDNQPG
jgi:hypothetical protein